MQNRISQYKTAKLGFGDTHHNRNVRADEQCTSRRELRTQNFAQNRKLPNASLPASPIESTSSITKDSRMIKLMKWREERQKRKKLEDAKKKPIFKVGVVHHDYYSPIPKYLLRSDIKKPNAAKNSNVIKKTEVKKGITRATEKRLLAKATSKTTSEKAISTTAQKTTNIPKNLTKQPSLIKSPPNAKVQKSFAPDSHKFKVPLLKLKKMPLFGTVLIEETPPEKGDFFENKKLTEQKKSDLNNLQDTLQQNTQNIYSNVTDNTTVEYSNNSKSNSQNSNQKINKSPCNINKTASDLNEIVTKLSLDDTTHDSLTQNSQPEIKSLTNNTDMEESLHKTPTNEILQEEEDLIVFSPYLTLSRGKSKARKEQMLRLGISRKSLSDDIPTKDTVMKNLNICIEEEERTAQYFKFLLNKETERLKDLCQKWVDIQQREDVPEDAVNQINQAVGQTKLLIANKFERFRNLVSNCEAGQGKMIITCKDLQGFWDLTYMEVRNCDLRFEKLEECRNSEWKEEQFVVKPIKKKRIVKKPIISSKSSSLRALIAARRKEMTGTSNEIDVPLSDENIVVSSPNRKKSIAFKENIDIRSHMKSKFSDGNIHTVTPAKRNSSKGNLIEKVQLSSTNKRMISPYTVMRISKLYKTPEIQLDDTISYVNSDQTPGKSILKKSEETIYKEKSAHKVNFNEIAPTYMSEKKQIKQSLAVALSRIDALDLDEINQKECINVEKKLTFEDSDSSDNLESISDVQSQFKEEQATSKLPIKNITSPTDEIQNNNTHAVTAEISNDNIKIKPTRRSLRHRVQRKDTTDNIMKETAISDVNILLTSPLETNTKSETVSSTTSDMEENSEPEVRILRSRIILTPKKTPRKKSSSRTENKNVRKSNRKSSQKLSQKEETDELNVTESSEYIHNRRKSRKSVAFDAETCLACVGSKPVLPMTPHSKQSQVRRRNQSELAINENSTAGQTPRRHPNRVKRSLSH